MLRDVVTVEDVVNSPIIADPLHRMDCVDCHNRPAHTFSATPDRALDEAIAQGRVPRDLPFLHREALAAFVSADPQDVAFVPNATAGFNTVLRSLVRFSIQQNEAPVAPKR